MRHQIALSIVFLAACSEPSAPITQQKEPQPPPPIPECPVAAANSGVKITQKTGPDFYICNGVTRENLSFQIYVGNFPEKVSGLEFYGTTESRDKSIVWLATARPKDDSLRTWVGYVPYGKRFPSTAVITFQGAGRDQFRQAASAIEQLTFVP